MAYCTTSDLLLGDIAVSSVVSKEGFVNAAAAEIDSKLGYLYVVPITGSVPQFLLDRLKFDNAKLATGRILLAITAASEDSIQNAYGASLVTDALADVQCMASGQDAILGAETAAVGSGGTDEGSAPMVSVADRQSGVEAFYEYVGQDPWLPIIPPPNGEPFYKPGPRGGYGPGGNRTDRR